MAHVNLYYLIQVKAKEVKARNYRNIPKKRLGLKQQDQEIIAIKICLDVKKTKTLENIKDFNLVKIILKIHKNLTQSVIISLKIRILNLCLIMHRNILSQQRIWKEIWKHNY